jgi:methylation protein EvaC
VTVQVIHTSLQDLLLLKPRVFNDSRGFFFETYNERVLADLGIHYRFVQDNHSQSRKNVLRGLHYQIRQPQGKLVRVVYGEVFDVAVDLRRASPTFGKWTGHTLSAENKHVVWIPPGFAHGFLVLSERAEFEYKATDFYAPEHERTILWNDPDLAIDWPLTGPPELSVKDELGRAFREAEAYTDLLAVPRPVAVVADPPAEILETSSQPHASSQSGEVMTATRCRVCEHPIEPFMSFGRQPIAQVVVNPEESRAHFTYELKPAFCASCGLFQLVDVPRPEMLFNDTYPFFTGTSQLMANHFRGWAEELLERVRGVPDPFIVEIGSNDGTLLSTIAQRRVRHLGVEPAKSVSEVARQRGVTTLEAFFGKETAQRIREEQGPADIIVAANVVAHISSVAAVADGVAALLKEDGIFTFEAVSLADVIRNTEFDQLYDEHVFTFSVRAVRNLFARVGLELIDVTREATHGGSLRYMLTRKGRMPVADTVAAALEEERHLGLDDMKTYQAFARRCGEIRDGLKEMLEELNRKGHPVVGYGATAKSTTVLNYCRVDSRLVEFIVDNTPMKQGKLTPGTHIPIRPPKCFAERNHDHTLLLAWNHRSEIERKESAYRQRGGKWILYIPSVAVV